MISYIIIRLSNRFDKRYRYIKYLDSVDMRYKHSSFGDFSVKLRLPLRAVQVTMTWNPDQRIRVGFSCNTKVRGFCKAKMQSCTDCNRQSKGLLQKSALFGEKITQNPNISSHVHAI